MTRIGLGVDTGGTYTDAVLLDFTSRTVIAKAKALTTRPNLAEGILAAIDALGAFDPASIRLVSISTTLATNAMVEGRGGRVALFAIGYDPHILERQGVSTDGTVHRVCVIPGGHTVMGEEQAPLDMTSVDAAIEATAHEVDAYAVSAVGGVRNPEHEQRVRDRIQERSRLPVVCGHELSSQLGSIRRAVTAALNARLLPLIRDLIEAVQHALEQRGIRAPLMIVKGDGHMMSARMAMQRPIETILSGPAASVVGGRFLAACDDGLVVDMGGTTTDIAIVRGGQPAIHREGASVGGWRTCVRAADIRTAGIGGDSHIRLEAGRIVLAPQRAVPLSLAASQSPAFLEQLRALRREGRFSELLSPTDGLILLRENADLPPKYQRLLEVLRQGPQLLSSLAPRLGFMHPSLIEVARLERLGCVLRVGLTPTDILHVEGSYQRWNTEAARIGAELYAYQREESVEAFLKQVRTAIDRKLSLECLSKLFESESGVENLPGCAVCEQILELAFRKNGASRAVQVQLASQLPIIAIGAPVSAYFPRVAEQLHASLVIPPHAEVANAVGAIAGNIVETAEVAIQPIYSVAGISHYVVHSAEGIVQVPTRAEAFQLATDAAQRLAAQRAQQAGAVRFEIRLEREEHQGSGQEGAQLFLGATVRAVAVGRIAGWKSEGDESTQNSALRTQKRR